MKHFDFKWATIGGLVGLLIALAIVASVALVAFTWRECTERMTWEEFYKEHPAPPPPPGGPRP